MNYFSKINQSEIKIDINDKSVLVDGHAVNCNLAPINAKGLHLLTVGGKTYEVFCHKKDGKYKVSFTNFNFSISVDDEKSRNLKKLIKIESVAPDHFKIKSPMPGLIIRVNVTEGDSVSGGQSLVIIEAMKMENEICAPYDGTITQLFVKEGRSVDKEAVLMVLQK